MNAVTTSPTWSDVDRLRSGKTFYQCLTPLVPWAQLQRPITWEAEFGRQAPLEVEIGYGNGDFLVRRAGEHPDRDLVGMELTWASTKRALRRIHKGGITNVRLLMFDAHLAFQRLFKPRSVRRVYALFPVPWPKGRHENRRLFSREFLRLVANRLQDEGEFQIVTDFEPLFTWIGDQVPVSGFDMISTVTSPKFQTKYEQKWQENGQEQFHEIILTKKDHPQVPITEDTPLLTYRIKNFDPENFTPSGQTGRITVQFRDTIYDPQKKKAMVQALVAEDRLIQDIWIEIAFTDENLWIIRVSRGSAVLPTAGVLRALELVRDSTEIN